jgi:hypothetical protein
MLSKVTSSTVEDSDSRLWALEDITTLEDEWVSYANDSNDATEDGASPSHL